MTLPDPIQRKLQALQEKVDQIISEATALITTQLPGKVEFRFENPTPGEVLTPYERAQSVSFITRYQHLPSDYTVQITEHQGAYYIGNLDFLRHALNDFRPLIMHRSDSVYYQEIHRVWFAMLTRDDPTKGTTIRALSERDEDVTRIYTAWLSEHNRATTYVLRPLDFDYIYNGILHHSGQDYSTRFLRDYTSGEFNYILWKHVHILSFIRELLQPYYQLMHFLTFLRLGPL